MGSFYQTDIEIFYIDDFGEHYPLPCALHASKPKFGWILPEGVQQVSFKFEIRTQYPKNYTRNGEPVFTSAYRSSGTVANPIPEYQCDPSMTTRLDDNVQESIGTWYGTCEVRLRIFDSAGNEYCTHAKTTTDTYDWERQQDGTVDRQYRKWGSHNNAYYFCFDDSVRDERNLATLNIPLSNIITSIQSGWTCTLQISDLPLFGDDNTLTGELQSITGLTLHSSVTAYLNDLPEGSSSSSSSLMIPSGSFGIYYGKTYYYRARTENGNDHTEWSDVKALRVIKNSEPICQIVGTYFPEERQNGEVVVTIRVDDIDHAYVKAWLAYSMRIDTQADADKIGAVYTVNGHDVHEVDANPSTSPLMSYNENTAGKFLRAVTKESLVHIPTNRDIEITWQTATASTHPLTAGKIMRNVYLYLFAYDGVDMSQSGFYPPNTASTPNGLMIDNTSIEVEEAGNSLNSVAFKIFGDIGWQMNYAILPDTMQRALMVHTLEFSSSNEEEEQMSHEEEGSSKATGEIGYVDGGASCSVSVMGKSVSGSYHNWYELYKRIEDVLGMNFLQRVTQEDEFSVYRYKKYNTYYPSYVSLDNKFGDEVYRGTGSATIFATDSNGAENKNSQYATLDTIKCHGFVSFCPKCNELHILKSVVKLADGTLYEDTYDNSGKITVSSLVKAFGENGVRFDGTPFELMFKCEGCNTLYPMNMRYHTHMSTGVYGSYIKDNYVYWHGYNSDDRIEDNGILQQQLNLTRKHDYELLVEEWKKEWVKQYCLEHGVSADKAPKPKDEDCPYIWVDVAKIQYAPGQQEIASSDNAKYNTEEFGFVHDDVLLKLDPRPEFDAYMKVIPPDAKSYHERIYNDGSKLNASIEQDYMHDFETKGEGQNSEPGDKALVRLAKQGPWWVQDRMMYQFFEGKKSINSVKEGYAGANSYEEGEEEEEEQSSLSPESDEGASQPINGVKEYSVKGLAKIGNVMNEGMAVVNTYDNADARWWTTLFTRMSCSGNVQFPIIIQRGVNDRFEYVVNDEKRVSGSILPDDKDVLFIDFPYEKGVRDYEHESEPMPDDEETIDTNTHTYYCNSFNDSKEKFLNVLKKIFNPVFNFDFRNSSGESTNPPFLKTFSYTMVGDLIETIQNSDSGKNVNVVLKTIAFTLYGNTSLEVEDLKEQRYRKFELVKCENNCYKLFGIVPYVTYQSTSRYIGKCTTNNESTSGTPLLKMSSFPTNPDIKEDGPQRQEYEGRDEEYTYYYTERSTTKHEYDVEENPVDNDIEEFRSYTEEVEGHDKPRNVKFRKPNRNPSKGEPLFTCYKDEVDENGYHFRFTPEDYKKTGKIYVRRYHVESCNPFPLDGYGYRNWIVVPIDGKPGHYRKQQVFNLRGATAVPKPIQVALSSDGPIITEIGWFPSENENVEPFSHDRSSSSSSAVAGQSQQQSQEKIYKRKKGYEWRNEMYPKTCVVFDYVDISEAMCKNPFTPENESPLTHVCPINFNSGIFKSIMVDRYGIYVLGGYDLTDQQKSIQDDGLPYTKEFTYENDETGETEVLTETLPNNWRPTIMDAVFDTVENEKQTVTVVDLTKKNTSSNSSDSSDDWKKLDYATKTVDTYARYKQEWEGKIEAPANPVRELSQQTVEQFNPAFHASFSIWEKYGYQPMKTLQQYFKEDEDGLYKGKYIPLSSKLVHGIYHDPVTGEKGDPYADQRIIGEVMRERHVISDKTFMKVDDTYDKLPFLDYRIIGKSVYQLLPYFSGYPRSEHPLYATRPEPPYPYDRQWRIGGWRMFERDSFQQQKKEAEEEATNNAILPSNNGYYKEPILDMQVNPGAQIGELSEYTINSFLYLQKEWNSFNRLHWTVDSGSNVYLCLVGQRRNDQNQNVGNPFSVKTRNSFWHENLSIAPNTKGAWCIKYDGTLSDMVDMSETTDIYGNPMFIDGEPYIFMLMGFTENNNGQIGDSGIITSGEFRISETAISPATIVATDYDPWTKILTITFRFDDALGRDYDIVGFQYIENDYTLVPIQGGGYQKVYATEDNFITPGGDDSNGTGVLIGNLYNLASNVRTSNMVSDELLITHTLKVNIGTLGIGATANLRIKLLSALSSDRMGLTVPVFTVKMWANEFLKPVEEQIMSLQGYKTQWKWVETYDESTGKSTGKWTFLDNQHAIRTIGRIQETKNSIKAMSDKFDDWFRKTCKFCPEAVGDIDTFESWLKTGKNWNTFYYGYFFLTYLVWNVADGYYDDYTEYASTLGTKETATTKARKWLQYKGIEDEYESWYNERRLFLLMSYKDSLSTPPTFESSIKVAMSLGEAHVEFAKSKKSEYKEYAGLATDDESSSDEELVVTPAEALQFIEETEREKEFISFYASKNLYGDTRFLERALVMCQMFGVATNGVWEDIPSDAPFAGEYESWLSTSGYGSLSLSDKYQVFIATALDNQKKTQLIQSYSAEAVVTDERYSDTPIVTSSSDVKKASISDIGRSFAFSIWLQSPSGNGSTNSQKWQALSNTLVSYRKLLATCLNEKNMLESDFRRDLVKQGYFCNGFLENQPYVSSENNQKVNTCFRWRVETRQYEGSMDTSQDSRSKAYGSYEDRYDMYYHFQMDFFDTFNSQEGGKPVTDVIFIRNGETDDCRILAGIDDADNSARTAPLEEKNSDNTNYVPQRQDLVVDRTENEQSQFKSSSNIQDLRFTAIFGLPLTELPHVPRLIGEKYDRSEILLPEPWWQAWDDEIEEIPEGQSYEVKDKDFKSVYYWRVAPYNLLDVPCFETLKGEIRKSSDKLVIDGIFHSDQILACRKPSNLYYNTSMKSYPVWTKNSSCPALENKSQYLESSERSYSMEDGDTYIEWINKTIEKRGDVQFITDRPRKVDYVESQSEVLGEAESYLISNQYGFTRLPDKLYGKYLRVNANVFSKSGNNYTCYIYKATMGGNEYWFIGTSYNATETLNGSWLYRMECQYPELASIAIDHNNEEIPVNIFASFGSNTQTTVQKPVLSYIKDNLGNYDTQWIPFNPERRKPFVVRFRDQYLMFTHKKTGMAVNGNVAYPANVITISRGFSSDVFGEEGMCIPKYTFESVGDYVKDVNGLVSKDAVSVENPCVVGLAEGMWRMYFNAVFFDGTAYYSKIYKADTVDFVDWLDISEVTVSVSNVVKTNYYQPNVVVSYNGAVASFEMYAVSTDHYYSGHESDTTTFTTIKRLTSSDGINFTYAEEIHEDSDGFYNICSPCIVKFSDTRKKLYFTIESARTSEDSSVAGVIGSIEWDSTNGWRRTPYNGMSRIILEKADDSFTNVVNGLGRVFSGYAPTSSSYLNPCVIWDYFNGARVLRMYYNTYDHPYAYSSDSLEEIENLNELVIKTDYLEEWNWSHVSFPDVTISASENGATFYIPSACSSATLFMARIVPTNAKLRCMAQGKWIGYDNVENTDAILLPETNNEVDYSLNKYSPLNWIAESNYLEEYNTWLNGRDTSNENALLWLMETKNYPKYLWWSRKGPGIYRYVGYEAIKDSEWKGKVKESV